LIIPLDKKAGGDRKSDVYKSVTEIIPEAVISTNKKVKKLENYLVNHPKEVTEKIPEALNAFLVTKFFPVQESRTKKEFMAQEHVSEAQTFEIDALRQLGDMLKATERAKGTAGKGNPDWLGGSKTEPPSNDAPTLSDLGINKKTSSLAQKLATLPEAANNCTIRDSPLLINRIGGKTGNNWQGYPQILWTN
jgi:hypothetical protein